MKTPVSMKTFMVVCFASAVQLYSQPASIPNYGFENWTLDIDSNLNPVGWETTNSKPLLSVSQYTPAYSGNYSMLVQTYDLGSGYISPGIATLDFPIAEKPTYVTGYAKANLATGDEIYIMVAMWSNDTIVASPGDCTFKFTNSTSTFQQFTLPLTYITSDIPDSVTILVIAGALSTAKIGTQVIVDELSFGSGTQKVSEITPNATTKPYPNPATDKLFIPFHLIENTDIYVDIYNSSGQKVVSGKQGYFMAGKQVIPISVSDFPPGIYHYTISGESYCSSGKLLVK